MIRKATLSDVNQIVTVIMRSWKVAYDGIIDPKYIENMKKDRYVSIFRNNIVKKEGK